MRHFGGVVSGPWDGFVFLGIPGMDLTAFAIAEDDGSLNFHFTMVNSKLLIKFVLSFDGKLAQLDGNYGKEDWNNSWMAPENDCDIYGICGIFGICNPRNSPICSCLPGFEPKKLYEWKSGNWTNGRVRKGLLQCKRAQTGGEVGKVDGFLKMQSVKVPDYAEWSPASTEQSCRDECLGNCLCIAYAYNNGFGCMSWMENLIDIQQFFEGRVDLNLRLTYLEFDGGTKNLKMVISIAVSIGAITMVICVLFSRWLVVKHRGRKVDSRFAEGNVSGDDMSPGRLQEVQLFNLQNKNFSGATNRMNQVELQELPLFILQKLATATDNFDLFNKLGQGGFGSVDILV